MMAMSRRDYAAISPPRYAIFTRVGTPCRFSCARGAAALRADFFSVIFFFRRYFITPPLPLSIDADIFAVLPARYFERHFHDARVSSLLIICRNAMPPCRRRLRDVTFPPPFR